MNIVRKRVLSTPPAFSTFRHLPDFCRRTGTMSDIRPVRAGVSPARANYLFYLTNLGGIAIAVWRSRSRYRGRSKDHRFPLPGPPGPLEACLDAAPPSVVSMKNLGMTRSGLPFRDGLAPLPAQGRGRLSAQTSDRFATSITFCVRPASRSAARRLICQ